jgi:microcystin-dependent protein
MPFVEKSVNIPKATQQDIIDQNPNVFLTAGVIIDEDNMVSDSNVRIPTQQSIVAYVTNQLAGGVTYRGTLSMPCDLTTNSTGNTYADGASEYKVGDLFVVLNDGTLTLSDGTINVTSGDALIINTDIADSSITIAMVDDIQATNPSDKIFTGDYKQSAKNSNHGGWLICNGSAVSRTTYLALFNEIGTSFGAGDGSTTFNLPDFTGKIFGTINGSHPLGQTLGVEDISLSSSNIPSHTHTINHDHPSVTSSSNGSHSHTYDQRSYLQKAPYGDNTRTVWEYDTFETRTTSTAPAHSHTVDILPFSGTSGATGSGTAFSIMQPTLFGGNIFIYSGV